jgi:signal transduction histidine kinase
VRQQWSIRWWLASLVAGIGLPLLILLAWLTASQMRRERTEARQSALQIAKATAGRLRTLHHDSLLLLEQMAKRPAIRDFDGRTCDSLFAIVDFFPQYANLILLDDDGKVRCAADPRMPAQSWIDSELRSGRLQPRMPRIGSMVDQWIAIVALPVQGGSFRGTLVLVDLPEAAGREALPSGSVVTIFDSSGTVLARSDCSQKWIGKNIRGIAATDIAMREKEGTTEARGLDGLHRLYGFTSLPEMGWYVVVGIPIDVVMKPVREGSLRAMIIAALIVLILIPVAIVMSRAIGRPIHSLADAATAMAGGAYTTVEAGGTAETAALAAAFNDMVVHRSRGEQELKALSDRLLAVQEHERTRIAREIHDDLGQSLTALKMDVVGLLHQIGRSPPLEPLRARILATLDATVTSVQRIAAELRPGILDDLGLVPALEAEARAFEERTGIECELSLDEDARISSVLAAVIYRIVQEALTNVARHSNATRVEVRLRSRADELLLEVRDDGRGVTTQEVGSPRSLGFIGIRERAAMVGGAARFEGIAGRGTIVSVRIPLPS